LVVDCALTLLVTAKGLLVGTRHHDRPSARVFLEAGRRPGLEADPEVALPPDLVEQPDLSERMVRATVLALGVVLADR
jgi:hypothetical protein